MHDITWPSGADILGEIKRVDGEIGSFYRRRGPAVLMLPVVDVWRIRRDCSDEFWARVSKKMEPGGGMGIYGGVPVENRSKNRRNSREI